MITYRHRQLGTLVLCLGGACVLLIVLLLYLLEPHPVGIAALCLLILCLVLFPTLTVEVTESEITLKFGPGVIRRSFPLGSVRSARAVRNAWHFGWGIRLVRRGLLYNVSGLDAVELEMTNGRFYRIGTDQPAELLRAIREAGGIAG